MRIASACIRFPNLGVSSRWFCHARVSCEKPSVSFVSPAVAPCQQFSECFTGDYGIYKHNDC
jgi:hypothetical protein